MRYVDAMFVTMPARAEELLHQRRAERRFKARGQRQRAQDIVADIVAGTESLNFKRRAEQMADRMGRKLTDNELIALLEKIEGTKAQRIEDATRPTIKIVFFGAACFRSAIKGHTAVPRKAIVRRLAARGIVVITDEYHSSQYCACQASKLENDPTHAARAGARQRRHTDGSAACSFLRVYGDRDALAALNILVCGIHALWGASKPAPFRRTP
jgi:transposase